MTNAIEQAKREMYNDLKRVGGMVSTTHLFKTFESSLESYLEILRQDHEALHETARKRFEDLQVAEAANQELQRKNDKQYEIIRSAENTAEEMTQRLAKMTEERDSIQLRLHAVDHAYKTQQGRAGTSGQTSGDRASCVAPGASTDAILKAVSDIKMIATDWALNGLRAKTAIRSVSAIVNGRASVLKAMHEVERPATCMHSFFAIGQDQMKCTFCGVGK